MTNILIFSLGIATKIGENASKTEIIFLVDVTIVHISNLAIIYSSLGATIASYLLKMDDF